jgi:hypothetical protein
MTKDIIFIFMVLSITVYAHSNKDKIIHFIEFNEELEDNEEHYYKAQCPIIYTDPSE